MHFSSKHNVEFNLPHIVISGFESAGRTVLLSLLTRSVIGYSEAGLSISCPVQYVFQRSKTTSYKFEDIECTSKRDLLSKVEKHMKSLNGKISSKTITIELFSPDYANFYILKLPGLQFGGQTEALIDVIKTNLKKETIFLLVTDSVSDAEQSDELTELKNEIFSGKDFSHDHQIIIMNKVGNSRIQEYNNMTPDTANFYHNLPTVDVNQISNNDVGIANRYITDVYPSVEQEFIMKLSPSNISVDNIGLTNLEKKLQKIVGTKLSKESESIVMKLSTMQDEIQRELDILKDEIKTTDISPWRNTVISFTISAIGLFHRNGKVQRDTYPKLNFSGDNSELTRIGLGFQLTNDEAESFRDVLTCGEEGKECAQKIALEIGQAMHTQRDLLLGLIGRSFRNMMEHILANNPTDAATELLLQQMPDAYHTVMSRKLDQVIARWEDGIELVFDFQYLDILNALTMEDILPRQPGQLENIDDDKIDKAETKQASEQGSGYLDKKSRDNYMVGRRALAQVRQYIRQNSYMFNLAYIIDDDFSIPINDGPKFREIDDVASDYYHLLENRWLDLEKTYSYRVLQYLGDTDTAVMAMTQEVANELEKDEVGVEKLKIAGANPDVLDEIARKNGMLSEIQDLLEKFKS